MSRTERKNFTKEDLSLTRADVMMLLDKKREPPKKGERGPGKSLMTPDDIRNELRATGRKDEEIEKVIGDLDSYQ